MVGDRAPGEAQVDVVLGLQHAGGALEDIGLAARNGGEPRGGVECVQVLRLGVIGWGKRQEFGQ